MTVWLRVVDDRIQEAGFVARGCDPSIAAGSAMTEMITGGTIEDGRGVEAARIEALLGGLPPVKRHSAILAARALRRAIADYDSRGRK